MGSMNSNSPDCSVEVVEEITILFSWAIVGDAKKNALAKVITSRRVVRNLIKYFQTVATKIMDVLRYLT
jgi:hypothetical protein